MRQEPPFLFLGLATPRLDAGPCCSLLGRDPSLFPPAVRPFLGCLSAFGHHPFPRACVPSVPWSLGFLLPGPCLAWSLLPNLLTVVSCPLPWAGWAPPALWVSSLTFGVSRGSLGLCLPRPGCVSLAVSLVPLFPPGPQRSTAGPGPSFPRLLPAGFFLPVNDQLCFVLDTPAVGSSRRT